MKSPKSKYVSAIDNDALPIIQGSCGEEPLNILVDTGSAVTLLDGGTARKLREKVRMEPLEGECWIKSITGQEIETVGKFEVTIRVEGRELLLTVFVTKQLLNEKYSLLMGIDMLRKHKIIFSAANGSISYSDTLEKVNNEPRVHPGKDGEGAKEGRKRGIEAAAASCSAAVETGSEVNGPRDRGGISLHPHEGITVERVDGEADSGEREEQCPVAAESKATSAVATLERKRTIEPGREEFIELNVGMENRGLSELLLLSPLAARKNSGLLLPHSVVCALQTEGDKVYSKVANPTCEPIHLNKGTKLFEIEPVELKKAEEEMGAQVDRNRPLTEADFDLKHLEAQERGKILELVGRYADVFARDAYGIQGTDLMEHEIRLTDDKPIRLRQYKVPHALKPVLKEQVAQLLDSGVIRPSSSAYGFPVVLVKKRDGSHRFCVDFRRLNEITRKDSYPLPLIHQTLDMLHGARYFSSLDLTAGYHQIPIKESDKHKTAFVCEYGLFEHNRLPFGMVNSSATFERAMDTIFNDLREDAIFVYVDDILCASTDLDAHLAKLEVIFQRLRKHGLRIKPQKCHFLDREITYLGHKLDGNGVRPDPRNVEAVRNFSVPRNVRQVRSFIGLCTFYRRHVKDFTKIAAPLTNLTRKGVKFLWDEQCREAFEKLKNALIQEPVLAYPDFTKKFFVTCDASNLAVGGILEQEGEDGSRRPIAYFSRKLNPAEKNYSTIEQEALAVVSAVAHWRVYLAGRKFTVITDHRPLRWLMTLKTPNSRLVRWNLSLSEYDFDVEYRPGKANTNADALSRQTGSPPLETAEIANISPAPEISTDMMREAQRADERLSPLINQLEGKDYAGTSKTADSFFLRDGLLYHYSLPAFNSPRRQLAEQLVVPDTLKLEVMKRAHDTLSSGHFGFDKTLARVRQRFFWLNMYADIKNYVASCDPCARRKGHKPGQKATLVIPKVIDFPWEKVALDIAGPLPMTERGNRFVLVITDHFTKYTLLIPLKDQRAETIADAFIEQVVTKHGVPKQLLTDRGTNFLSELMKELYSRLGIHKLNTSPYHPQGDGQAERQIQTLINSLSIFCSPSQRDWDDLTSLVAMAYNASTHAATRETPNFLLYGRDLNLPGDLLRAEPTFSYSETETYTEDLVSRLQEAFQIVKANLELAGGRAKFQRDKTAKAKDFSVGERVYLFTPAISKGKVRKLTNFSQPYRIIGRNGPVNYTLRSCENARKIVHAHADRIHRIADRRKYPSFNFGVPRETTANSEGASVSDLNTSVTDGENLQEEATRETYVWPEWICKQRGEIVAHRPEKAGQSSVLNDSARTEAGGRAEVTSFLTPTQRRQNGEDTGNASGKDRSPEEGASAELEGMLTSPTAGVPETSEGEGPSSTNHRHSYHLRPRRQREDTGGSQQTSAKLPPRWRY